MSKSVYLLSSILQDGRAVSSDCFSSARKAVKYACNRKSEKLTAGHLEQLRKIDYTMIPIDYLSNTIAYKIERMIVY